MTRQTLSPAQQRLWFLQQLQPTSSAYQLTSATRLSGVLDLQALSAGLATVLERHEVLRSLFPAVDGEPVMEVLPKAGVRLEHHDLASLPAAECEQECDRLRAQLRRPFDLGAGSPLRAALLSLGDEQHLWVLVVHSIIADRVSIGIISDELAHLYRAHHRGVPADLPDPQHQLAELNAAQLSTLQGAALQRFHDFWLQRLGDCPRHLPLPSDRHRPQLGQQTRLLERALPADLAERLEALAAALPGCTVETVILAAFQVLLARLGGVETVLLGYTTANRQDAMTHGVIGPLANKLVVRSDLEPELPFQQHVRQLGQSISAAVEHRDLPFAMLVQLLHADEENGDHPIFAVALEDPGDGRLELDGLRAQAVHELIDHSPLALQIGIRRETPALQAPRAVLRLVFQSARCSRQRAELLLEQLLRLLEQVLAAPQRPVGSCSLVTASCRELLPDPTAPIIAAHYRPVTELLATQAAAAPDLPAVRHGFQLLSYADLNERAAELARTLVAAGLCQGEVVALTGPVCIGLTVGITGVLLAGGVVVTIDPELPPARQRMLLEEASVVLALRIGCDPEHEIIAALPSWLLDCEDGRVQEQQAIPGRKQAPLESVELLPVEPSAPAYIAFTSGSSGVPNAVLAHHRGLSHFVTWERRTFAVGPDDRCAQLSALGFDVLLREMFLALTSGALLELPPAEPGLLLPWLARRRITLMHTVPSLLQLLLTELPEPVPLLALRQVFLVGEPLTDTLVRRWRESFPASAAIVNLYGTTECNLAKCWYQVPEPVEPGVQPGGRPLPETQVLVLNRLGVLCGRGEPGEIVLRSPHLSYGYLNAPQEKQARFTSNPFADPEDPDDRCYRSGDRGRYRCDGCLELLGRLDRQVQIHGVRIEPDEVQAILARHAGVAACAVVAHEIRPGEHTLVAYVVLRRRRPPQIEELHRFLEDWLPRSVQPSRFILLERLPLGPGGKLDYKALPEPSSEQDPAEPFYLSSRSEVEEILAGLWSELLGISRISGKDSFFHLGGHSLLATRLAIRLRSIFHVELPLRSFFEHPTLEGMAAAVLQAARDAGGEPLPATPPQRETTRLDELPLSSAQQRLWFMSQLAPTSPVYNLAYAWDIHGDLNRVVLEKSLQHLVERHEVLRTTVVSSDGRPSAQIAAGTPFTMPVINLGALPPERRQAEVQRRFEAEASRPFSLEQGPLLRVLLLRLEQRHHLLVLVVHHIVWDGWSREVFNRELSLLYESLQQGVEPALPKLAIQYTDYAVWQRRWLSRGVLERQLAYWTAQLADLPTLQLPTDRPRAVTQGLRCAAHERVLSAELVGRLEGLSRSSNASLFMTLLGAFSVLLHRWTGQDDIVVGAPVANRSLRETEGLIGFFVNNLVLRCTVEENERFHELLERVRQVVLDAYAHQDLPFDRLVETLAPQRDLGQHPLFQVVMVLHSAPQKELELSGLCVSASTLEAPSVQLDLELHLWNLGDGRLRVQALYDADLFDAPTIARLAEQYEILLEGIAADPGTAVRALPLLSPAERRQLLSWAGHSKPFADQTCFHHLFEDRVRESPNVVAVQLDEQLMTREQLNQQANRLAHYLRQLGVGPETLVGLCLERSLDLVVGILAILKAGGAYLPLDPEYPEHRLQLMLDDAAAELVLCQQRLLPRLPADRRLIAIDGPDQPWQSCPANDPESGVAAGNLAYVIYTSGSTGTPKGVLIEHRGICNLVMVQVSEFGINAKDRVLQFASSSFDGSVWELLALASGATLVLAGKDSILPGPPLEELLQRQQISAATLPPSVLAAMPAAQLPQLTTLVVAGDPCTPELIRQWAPGRRFINGYGPTEVTVCATCGHCNADSPLPLIGRAVANQEVYLLDPYGEPVPIGVAGEIHVGGIGLARGYLNRPQLTAERFIPHPFRPGDGARLYRTGDLGRFRADGSIEFLGRIDQQVKLRGFRIEPGEIESVLQQHQGVDRALVVARNDLPGGRGLAAYVVPAEPAAGGEGGGTEQDLGAQLREHLRRHLPEFMVPAALILLPDGLPLTPSGKVDMPALPAPLPRVSQSSSDVPRSPLEERLAAIWCEVLDLPQVGIHDSFFDLGGDSILSIQVVSRARRSNLPMSARDMFEQPTVAGLAAALAARSAIAPVREETGGLHPLTPIQQWFFELDLAVPDHFNQSVLLRVNRALDPDALEAALQDLVSNHETLRLRFSHDDRGWHQELVPGSDRTLLHVEDLRHLPRAAQERAIGRTTAELNASLDIAAGPVLRAAYLRLGGDLHDRLLIVAHHLVVDGVSWSILLDDLEQAVQARSAGEQPDLGAATASYLYWAGQLAELAAGGTLDEELASTWLQSRAAQITPLPLDFHRGPDTVATKRTVVRSLAEQDTKLLLQRGAGSGSQIEAPMLAALARTICAWAGMKQLWIDLESHGRLELVPADASRTVGWFTALYPVLISINPKAGREPVLRSVARQLAAIPHRGLGFGLLRYLSPRPEVREALSSLPERAINFNYLGRIDRILPSHSLFELIDIDNGATQAPENRRPHLLSVNGAVLNGRLSFRWGYSESFHRRETIRDLAEHFSDELRALARQAASLRSARETASGSQDPAGLLVPFNAQGSRPPLVLVHPVGGTVHCYADLAGRLGAEQPVLAVRAWTDAEENPLYEDIPALAARYLRVVRRRQPTGPYRLAGWSMGGVIAFEMACQLVAAGERVELLCLIDVAVPDGRTPWWLTQLLKQGKGGPGTEGMLPEERAHRYLQCHIRAMTEYRPGHYPGDLLLLATRKTAAARNGARLGWERFVHGRIDVVQLSGEHHTLLQEPQVGAIAHHLGHYLAGDTGP